MTTHRTACLLVGIVIAAASAQAQLAPYDRVQLVARAATNGAHRLPDGAVIEGQAPELSDWLQVAVRATGLGGGADTGLFFGDVGDGSVVYSVGSGVELNHPHLAVGERIVFERLHSGQDGIYQLDLVAGGIPSLVTALPAAATGWDSPQLNRSGQIGFRAVVDGSYRWLSWDGVTLAEHAAEVAGAPLSPYSLLYRPSFNDARQMAGKVRLGGDGEVGEDRPDQIRIFETTGSSVLIAEDADANASSPWASFDDWVSLSADGRVAFVATGTDGYRYVLLSDGSQTTTIAVDSLQEIGSIEATPVAANDHGLVAFRGTYIVGAAKQAIGVGDGTNIEVVAIEFDTVTIEDGSDARYRRASGGTVFTGELAIDRWGSVAFIAALTPADNDTIDWGTGLFIATAGMIFADGFELADSSRWSSAVGAR